MATFSTTSFVSAANGSAAPTTASPPAPFASTGKAPNNVALQVAAQQQHIFHQSLAHQQVRQSLATASAPAGSPPTPAQTQAQQQQQQQNTMQQAFQVNKYHIYSSKHYLTQDYFCLANGWSSWAWCPAVSET